MPEEISHVVNNKILKTGLLFIFLGWFAVGTQSRLGTELEAKVTIADYYALASSFGTTSRKNLH